MKKYKYFIIGSVFAIFTIIGLNIYWSEAQEEAHLKKVKVAKVEKEVFQDYFIASGTIKGEEETSLAFDFSGRLKSIFKKEGDTIRKGETLAIIDGGELYAEKNLVYNQLDNAEKLYEKTDDYYDQLVDEAKANLDKSEESYEIAKEGDDESAKKIAKKEVEKNEEVVKSAKASRELKLESVESEEDFYRNKISIFDESIQKTRLIAPYDGIVVSRNFDIGATVSPGKTVFAIAKSDNKELKVSVPLDVFRDLKIDDSVEIIYNENNFILGSIKSKTPRSGKKSFRADITVKIDSNTDLELGSFAKIRMPMGNKKTSLAIPIEAVNKVYHENIVFLAKNNKAKSVFVKLGSIQDGKVEVEDGLNEKDLVVIAGNQYLEDNDFIEYE
jgi:HlyD family secretion protein